MYRPCTRYQVCCTWNEAARDSSTYVRVLVYYCCNCIIAALPHILISLLNFGGVVCRISFASSANTPKTWWEGNLLFLAEGEQILRNVFSQTLLRTKVHSRHCWTLMLGTPKRCGTLPYRILRPPETLPPSAAPSLGYALHSNRYVLTCGVLGCTP